MCDKNNPCPPAQVPEIYVNLSFYCLNKQTLAYVSVCEPGLSGTLGTLQNMATSPARNCGVNKKFYFRETITNPSKYVSVTLPCKSTSVTALYKIKFIESD